MALRKLTLSIDESVIERAREYSERHQTSITRLVSSYLDALARTEPELAFSPAVRRCWVFCRPKQVARNTVRTWRRSIPGEAVLRHQRRPGCADRT